MGCRIWPVSVRADARARLRDVRGGKGRIEELKSEIESRSGDLAHLEAEWAYLNRPERLAELVRKFHGQLRLTDLTAERTALAADFSDRDPQPAGGPAERISWNAGATQ